MRVKCGHEKTELRWKLWLSEKVILFWASLMEVMLMVEEIRDTVWSAC